MSGVNEAFRELRGRDLVTPRLVDEGDHVTETLVEDALLRYFELGVHHALGVARGVLAGREGPYFADLRPEEDLR